jgi:ArsR family transcriptional regulator
MTDRRLVMPRYADIFKALSDETRLTMLALLSRHGELCVCDFVGVLGVTHSKASRHLRYLRNAGLLQDRRDAVWVYYRIAPDVRGEPAAVLEALGPLLKGFDTKDAERALRAWMKRKKGERCSVESTSSVKRPGKR